MELMVMENKEKITKSPKCIRCKKDLAPERAEISSLCVKCKSDSKGDFKFICEPLGTRWN